eukprot:1191715-Prorocentrum_minimum.AAC.2
MQTRSSTRVPTNRHVIEACTFSVIRGYVLANFLLKRREDLSRHPKQAVKPVCESEIHVQNHRRGDKRIHCADAICAPEKSAQVKVREPTNSKTSGEESQGLPIQRHPRSDDP